MISMGRSKDDDDDDAATALSSWVQDRSWKIGNDKVRVMASVGVRGVDCRDSGESYGLHGEKSKAGTSPKES